MQTISLGEHLPGGANIVLNIDVLNSHHEYIHDGRKYHQDINISFIALELKLKLKFIHGHFNLSESNSIALTRKTITLDISDSPTDLKVS